MVLPKKTQTELENIINTVIAECESTNDLGKELAEAGASQGTWISSLKQSAGRGRLGRTWLSAEGNLFLSVILRPPSDFQHWGWLPLAIGVAVSKAVDHVRPHSGIKLKWPNDLWVGEAKAGGILCEASSAPTANTKSYVIAGIGLNCVTAPTTDVKTAALGIPADELRPLIIDFIRSESDSLFRYGPSVLRDQYQERSLLPAGTEVEWTGTAGTFAGAVRGLGESGELLVSEGDAPDAKEIKLFAEDVKIKPRLGAGAKSPA